MGEPRIERLPVTGYWSVNDDERGVTVTAETEALARAYAAAPILLAACEDARDFLRSHGYDTRIMDAAVAAAKGETSP